MNRVIANKECWFIILFRRLLIKHSSFLSIENLVTKIKDFIAYYNKYVIFNRLKMAQMVTLLCVT